MDEKLTEN